MNEHEREQLDRELDALKLVFRRHETKPDCFFFSVEGEPIGIVTKVTAYRKTRWVAITMDGSITVTDRKRDSAAFQAWRQYERAHA